MSDDIEVPDGPLSFVSINQLDAMRAERDVYYSALRAIEGPCDSLPWIAPYREAGGGYSGLQAIARTALEQFGRP